VTVLATTGLCQLQPGRFELQSVHVQLQPDRSELQLVRPQLQSIPSGCNWSILTVQLIYRYSLSVATAGWSFYRENAPYSILFIRAFVTTISKHAPLCIQTNLFFNFLGDTNSRKSNV